MRQIRVPFFLLVAIFVPLATLFAIQIAKGYSFNFSKQKFEPRGILVATSVPDGAQVFINGKLETATNNTISLIPGDYQVEIKKNGFSAWSKKIKIEKELVAQTQTFLFLSVSDLRPITLSGAVNPTFSPDGTKIAFSVPATESAKAGLWVADLVEFPFGLGRSIKQIVKPITKNRNFTKAQISWSPDSRQILVTLGKENFLLDPNQLNLETNLVDITWNLSSIKAGWEEDEKKIQEAKTKRLPKKIQEILENSSANFNFSQDGEKLLYEATASAQIPPNLIPPLPAASTQKEERQLKPGGVYVYDLKEDKNFFITELKSGKAEECKKKNQNPSTLPLSCSPALSWFPTSRHLLWIEPQKVSLIEYDGTNKTTIFNGSFEDSSVFPAPSANKIYLLTKAGQEATSSTNLYSINLR